MEYAKSNNIEVKIQYGEEKIEKKPNVDKSTTDDGSHTGNMDRKKFNNKKPHYGGKNNNQYHKKNYNNNNNYNNNQGPYFKQPMHFSNKFDAVNAQMGGAFYNPFMFPQQMATPQNMYNYSQFTQPEDQDSEKSVSECLEYYFSEENLNKDGYIRSKMNDNGLIDAQEIANFNKMKNRGVTVEKIEEVLKENKDSIIETTTINGRLWLRNKNWESFAEKLVPLDVLLMQKKMGRKPQQTNYVTMQNNYFYQMTPGAYPSSGMYGPFDGNMNMYGGMQPNTMGYPMGGYPMGFMPQQPNK